MLWVATKPIRTLAGTKLVKRLVVVVPKLEKKRSTACERSLGMKFLELSNLRDSRQLSEEWEILALHQMAKSSLTTTRPAQLLEILSSA